MSHAQRGVDGPCCRWSRRGLGGRPRSGPADELRGRARPDGRDAVNWSGHAVPFVRRGDRWLATVGVDLDSRPGEHAVDVTFRYADGRTRVVREPVMVNAGQYPTTELHRRGALRRAQPRGSSTRGPRGRRDERRSTTRSPRRRYWTEPFACRYAARRTGATSAIAACSTASRERRIRAPICGPRRARRSTRRTAAASSLRRTCSSAATRSSSTMATASIRPTCTCPRSTCAVGDMVERGQQLGLAGATGRVTGAHLHWGVAALDARVDPFSLIRLGASNGGVSDRSGRNDPCPVRQRQEIQALLRPQGGPAVPRHPRLVRADRAHAVDRSLAGPHDDQLELITESPTAPPAFSARMLSVSGATALKARSPVWGFLFGPLHRPRMRATEESENAVSNGP